MKSINKYFSRRQEDEKDSFKKKVRQRGEVEDKISSIRSEFAIYKRNGVPQEGDLNYESYTRLKEKLRDLESTHQGLRVTLSMFRGVVKAGSKRGVLG
jgi:hypothetical protein|tara:strand:- start:163 stop:456 length:294 start_codon:yes stop_codon:yes gene_type:complete